MGIKPILIVFLAIFSFGCSSDSDDAAPSYAPLTSAQKTELLEFSQSMSDVGTAAGKVNRKKGINPNAFILNPMALEEISMPTKDL